MPGSLIFWLALQAVDPGASAALPAPPPTPSPAPVERRLDDPAALLSGAVPAGAYEARVRDAFARRQSRQGPADGAWLLRDAAGKALYRLQIVDPGGADAVIEGAWAAVDAPGSGFLAASNRLGERLVLQIAGPAVPAMLQAVFAPAADGGFSGEMRLAGASPDAPARAVRLVRP